jgi:uncharacterized protein (DUF885 family)
VFVQGRQALIEMRKVAAAAVASLVLVGPNAAYGAATPGDERLAGIAQAYFRGEWQFSPSTATRAGVHDYDGNLERVTPDAFAVEVSRLHATLAKVEAIAPSDLSLDGQVDRALLQSDIEGNLFGLEARPAWRSSPDYYVNVGSQAVFTIMAREFAPPERRLAFVIAREQIIPVMLQQAQANLEASKVPAISAQVGMLDAEGAADFLARDVPEAFTSVSDPKLLALFKASTAASVSAFKRYSAFIKTSIVPRAHASYAIGAAAYEHLETLQNVQDIPLSKLLGIGEANLAKDKAAFIATAHAIDAKATPQEVAGRLRADHPAADALLPTAQADLNDLVAFIKEKHIIDLPDAPVARVVPTPKFARQFTFASMDTPGPLEKKATEAYYNVTPVDSTWSTRQTADHLGFFNRYQTMIVSSHEAYPGHYVNYLFNKQEPLSLIRQLEWNPAFGEGWAHYDEQMMVDEGLGNGDPRYRLAQLTGALLRDCRYIVGIKEHTQGMSIDEGTKFFMDNAFVGREPAYRESVRGTQDPLYGYYTLGKLMLLKLRDDYRAKTGSQFSLASFHDALLSHGDPPIYYLRRLLLGPDDRGSLL